MQLQTCAFCYVTTSTNQGSVAKNSSFPNVPTFVVKTYLCFYNKRRYVLKQIIFCNRPQLNVVAVVEWVAAEKVLSRKIEVRDIQKNKTMLQHLKDYGIWLLAVFARGVMVFVFNTGKGRIPNCPYVYTHIYFQLRGETLWRMVFWSREDDLLLKTMWKDLGTRCWKKRHNSPCHPTATGHF